MIKIGNNIFPIIDEILLKVSISKLENNKINVYLCSNPNLYYLLSLVNINAGGLNVTAFWVPFSELIYVSRADIENNKCGPFNNSNRTRELSNAIAHEITHLLVRRKLGFIKDCKLEWKSEGYAEFIAFDGKMDFKQAKIDLQKKQYVKNAYNRYFKYFEFRLAATYLITKYNLDFDKFVDGKYDLLNTIKEFKNDSSLK